MTHSGFDFEVFGKVQGTWALPPLPLSTMPWLFLRSLTVCSAMCWFVSSCRVHRCLLQVLPLLLRGRLAS
jgi:hypothetical protein